MPIETVVVKEKEVVVKEKEAAKLRINRVTINGANTDGKNLFFEIDVFDGEHTNRLEPVFPYNTSAEEITKYCYQLIEESVKVPGELAGLMQKTIYWDAEEDGYYSRVGNGKPARHKEASKSTLTHTPVVTPSHSVSYVKK